MAAKKKLPPWLQKGAPKKAKDDAAEGRKRFGMETKPKKAAAKRGSKKVGAGQATGRTVGRGGDLVPAPYPSPFGGQDPLSGGSTNVGEPIPTVPMLPEHIGATGGTPSLNRAPIRTPASKKPAPKKKVGTGQSTGTQEVPALLAAARGPARRRKVVKGGAKGPGAD